MSTDNNIELNTMLEVASYASGYFAQNGSSANLKDITLNDLYTYLRNPYSNIEQIRNISKYLTNKHGVLREVLRAFRSYPSLEHMISWSDYSDEAKIKKYEKKVHDFIKNVNIKQVTRDGLYETAQLGTVVLCNRNNKYIQFLELDEVQVTQQKSGKWIVCYDLKSIDNYSNNLKEKVEFINSLPPEVTLKKYNTYKTKGEDHRYVEISKCRVIGIDTYRNYPYGLPYTIGAWNSILQKELVDKVERSIASNMLKQIVMLKAGYIDKNNDKLVPKEVINAYFDNISKVLTGNSPKNRGNTQNNDDSGVGLISLLQGLSLETLDINTDTFKKEMYDKVNSDVFMNLGISEAYLYGGSKGSYSSSQLNNTKFGKTVNETLDKFEDVINEFINDMLPKDLSCTFKFLKEDKKTYNEELKNLYLQTGASKYYLEAVTGLPYQEVIKQVEYERNVLKLDEVLNPPENFYTQSGNSDDKGGAPTLDDKDINNDNTLKSRSNGSNDTPKPSTS